MRNVRCAISYCIVGILLASVGPPPAAAAPTEFAVKTESNIFMQSLIVDSDLLMLANQVPDAQFSEPFHYVSTTDDKGWVGVLTGSVNGQPLVVDYTGSLAGDPELSWQSKGRTGPAWSGSGGGSVQIGSLAHSPITLAYNPLTQKLLVGTSGSTGIINWSILAEKNFDTHKFDLVTAAGVGLPFGLNLAELEAQFNLDQTSLDYRSRVRGTLLLVFHSRWQTINEGTYSSPESGLPVPNTMTVTLQPVPESSTLTLVGVGSGILWMLRYLRFRIVVHQ